MKKTGFTLVELLVVVLIIGVLTAVAVPMYQSAVDKSHFSTMLPSARAIKNAEEAYWMANGYYTNDETNLDVSAPAEDVTFTYEVKGEDGAEYNVIKATNSNLPNVRLASYLDDNIAFGGQIHCEALKNNERANKLCEKTLRGSEVMDADGYTSYMLDGTMDETTCTLAQRAWSRTQEKCYKDKHERCTALNMDWNTDDPDNPFCGYTDTKNKELYEGGSCYATIAYTGCQGSKLYDGAICDIAEGHTQEGGCSSVKIYDGGECKAKTNHSCKFAQIYDGGKCTGQCQQTSIYDGGICDGYCAYPNIYDGGVCKGGSCGWPKTYDGGVCAGTSCAFGTTYSGGLCAAVYTDACSYNTIQEGGICYRTNNSGCHNATYQGDDPATAGCCCGTGCPADHTCSAAKCAAATTKLIDLGLLTSN